MSGGASSGLLAWLVGALALGAAPARADCLAPGNAALAAGRYAEAAEAFAASRARADCAERMPELLLNEAYARQRLFESGQSDQACPAAALYAKAAARAEAPEIRETAASRERALASACAPPAPVDPVEPEQPPADADPPVAASLDPPAQAPDPPAGAPDARLWTTAAVLIAAGGLTYGFALSADADRAQARRDYGAAIAAGDADGWRAASDRFDDARTLTDVLGVTGLTLLAGGLITAGVGVALALSEPEPGAARLGVGPGGLSIGGAW